MATKRCMNVSCGVTVPEGEWKKGWGLKSGGFANLCNKCGYIFFSFLLSFLSLICDLHVLFDLF